MCVTVGMKNTFPSAPWTIVSGNLTHDLQVYISLKFNMTIVHGLTGPSDWTHDICYWLVPESGQMTIVNRLTGPSDWSHDTSSWLVSVLLGWPTTGEHETRIFVLKVSKVITTLTNMNTLCIFIYIYTLRSFLAHNWHEIPLNHFLE